MKNGPASALHHLNSDKSTKTTLAHKISPIPIMKTAGDPLNLNAAVNLLEALFRGKHAKIS